MYKRGAGSEHLRPVFSILNPELTQTLPAFELPVVPLISWLTSLNDILQIPKK